MASNPLLTLSSKGVLTGIEERCDRLWAYFMTSQPSQDVLYPGQIKSLPALIAQSNADPVNLQSSIEAALVALFGAQFDTVNCAVTVTMPAWDGSQRYNIAVDMVIIEKGSTFSLGKALESINGVLQPLLTQNNG